MNITLQKKRTTRNIKPSYEINRKTIDTQHMEHIQSFQADRATLLSIERELDECEAAIRAVGASEVVDHDRLVDLKDRVIELRQNRKLLLDNDSTDYFVNTANILFKYYDIVDSHHPHQRKKEEEEVERDSNSNKGSSILKYFSTKKTTVAEATKTPDVESMQRGHLLERYMEYTNANYVKTTILGDIVLVCPHCQSSNNTVIQSDGIMVCNVCNTIEYVIVDHDKPSYKDPPKEISYYAYKRLNHFNEWLNQVQG